MQIITEVTHIVPPQQLAKALANSTPQDFAEFWLAFGEAVEPILLESFAKAMAPALGANRKKVLKELVRLIEYYEVQSERFS